MKRKVLILLAIAIVILSIMPVGVAYAQPQSVEVYLGGTHLSVDMVQDGLVVMGFSDVRSQDGVSCPAREAGLKEGDVLRRIDGVSTRTRHDVQRALARAAGSTVTLSVNRGGQELTLYAVPAQDERGEYLLGVYLKDGVQGVGTLTYVRCDTHTYAALGHGIEDPDSGRLAEPYHGKVYASRITDIIKGKVGTAGELRGTLFEGAPIGDVTANTDYGIFGKAQPAMYQGLQKVAVAGRDQVQEGDAVIVCALRDETPKFYAVRITQCKHQTTPQQKGISIRVTDQRLIDATGGIVQGMSGSPILQNGKLVGAVTHVLIDNPTEGYGMYIEFMLQNG